MKVHVCIDIDFYAFHGFNSIRNVWKDKHRFPVSSSIFRQIYVEMVQFMNIVWNISFTFICEPVYIFVYSKRSNK